MDARPGLPRWRSVLAVTAHPDDESFGLGALLDAFRHGGAFTAVLCFTRGEASTLGTGRLARIRTGEAMSAALELGVGRLLVRDHPDGALAGVPQSVLAAETSDAAVDVGAHGLLVFDSEGITGHPDHVAATAAGVQAGRRLALPVLAWTIAAPVARALNDEFGTGFRGREQPDLVVAVDRAVQRRAIDLHRSQANPVVGRRLELSGGEEWLVWLHRPDHG